MQKAAKAAGAIQVTVQVSTGPTRQWLETATLDADVVFSNLALLIPVTLCGLASMGIAVLIHEGATVLVVLNALRRLRFVDAGGARSVQRTVGALTHTPRNA